jgi:hypothetical protein
MKIPFLRAGKSAPALAVILALTAFLLSPATSGAAAPIRIVNCGTHVQSSKRGVCENHMSAEDFTAFAPGVSWYYNWNITTGDYPPAGVRMDYFPQAWGHGDGDAPALDAYLSTHKATRVVLALNEPNLKDQSFMPPQAAADLYKKIKAVADKYHIPVVGPNMSLGSPDNGSITAIDPIDKKEVTYTFMIPYLKAFYFFMGDVPVPAAAYHTYGNIGELKWATGEIYKQFKKPVWITEFANWHAASPAESLKYLVQATDYFESSPFVAGYAFFKERASNNSSNISLLDPAPAPPGQLSALGKAYVNMPVHDADLYYRLPGRLSAGSYVQVVNSEIEPTDDVDGFFDMTSTGPAQLYYNIQVDKAGSYKLKIRASDSGKPIDVMAGDQVLGSTDRTKSGWQTVEVTVPLPAGPQVLHIRTGGQSVNWIEFSKVEPPASPAPSAAK